MTILRLRAVQDVGLEEESWTMVGREMGVGGT